jgi:hypothetical protein
VVSALLKALEITACAHGLLRLEVKASLTSAGLWIVSPESVNEIGCIHTCEGLELDYVGVIIGPDLKVRNGEVVTDAGERSPQDSSIRGYKKMLKEDPDRALALADLVIKNTYKTLLTRGMKACYVYSTDRETVEYFRSRLR